jgi:hypothetical protein
MIAGEFDYMRSAAFDSFLGLGKKKKNKKPKPSKEGEKKQPFLKRVGEKINNAGGVSGIGNTVDSVLGLFKKEQPGQEPASDYEIGIEKTTPSTKKQADQKMLITGAAIIGSLLLIGGLFWWMNSRKAVTISPTPQAL